MCFTVIAGGDLSSQIAAHGLETPGFPARGHPAEFNGCGILMAIGDSNKSSITAREQRQITTAGLVPAGLRRLRISPVAQVPPPMRVTTNVHRIG